VAAPAAGGVVVGGAAQVVNTDGYQLRIRQQPGLDAPIVSFAPAGAIVQVTGGPQNDNTGAPWYGIDYAGISGWVLGEHLAPATASTITPATSPQPATKPAPTAAPVATPKPTAQPIVAPAPASGQGQAVVAVVLKYLGVPYVYGGTTPSGWDCSGFVGYVYKEAAGITLPRSAAQQYRAGTAVPVGQEQAGDIVFFADTFGPGITHDGIALGDGRFVHARSEGYGTVISSLSDPYWGAHYAGARRP
jgi:cell wall-associated NlpC family hydrolase